MKKFTVYFGEKCGEYKKKKRQRVTIYVYFDEKCGEYKQKKKKKTKGKHISTSCSRYLFKITVRLELKVSKSALDVSSSHTYLLLR